MRWLLAALLTLGSVQPSVAEGLYKGHGRRTHDYAWRTRLNASVGFQGVEDPWDQFGVSNYPVGGYTSLGLEFAAGQRHSLELLGAWAWVHDDQSIVALGSPPSVPRPGSYHYEVDALSAGIMYRFWAFRGSTSTWLGMGGGWVSKSDLSYGEQVSGSEPFHVSASGTGPQFQIAIGYEGYASPALRVGMELGFRYTWVDFDQGIYGTGNFNGIYLGLRTGLVR